MRRLNLGILAHVDAGKTTLTERLLYAAGVIEELGSVDAGTTQTDSLDLERRRGITIKAAVVAFELAGLSINLIDTPGHPDFIAEVERTLGVLDGAVLVVSAVEGVQPQTRVLMRALRRLGVPTLIFINKIDRTGADPDRVRAQLSDRLGLRVAVLNSAVEPGSRAARVRGPSADGPDRLTETAEVLADLDDGILQTLVDGRTPDTELLVAAIRDQVARGLVHPVLVGSALTGVGTEELSCAIAALLPCAAGDDGSALSAQVFKVERGPAGERVCYVRMFSGRLAVRDRLAGDAEQRVTALAAFEKGRALSVRRLVAGQIGRVWGLNRAGIGDWLGETGHVRGAQFAPPSLEAVIRPGAGTDRVALTLALSQLAEQDPLINLRQEERAGETYVSLYGEVQKEVIGATLADDFGIEVDFAQARPLCIERPVGSGSAAEAIRQPGNPFLATVGLRIEAAPVGSGLDYRLEVELGALPYAFHRAIEDTVRRTLAQGLCGWSVTDCVVSLTHTGYWPRQSAAHQGFNKASSSTGYDFRGLTPLVAVAALREAGTVVCEPIHSLRLEFPELALGGLLPVLAQLGVITRSLETTGPTCVLEGEMPAERVHQLSVRLPDLTGGEGVAETEFCEYRPVSGPPPLRPRYDDNPLDRKEYLLRVTRRL